MSLITYNQLLIMLNEVFFSWNDDFARIKFKIKVLRLKMQLYIFHLVFLRRNNYYELYAINLYIGYKKDDVFIISVGSSCFSVFTYYITDTDQKKISCFSQTVGTGISCYAVTSLSIVFFNVTSEHSVTKSQFYTDNANRPTWPQGLITLRQCCFVRFRARFSQNCRSQRRISQYYPA